MNKHMKYRLIGLLALTFLWTTLAIYWFSTPVYTSRWSIVLPHTNEDARIALEDIGQATLSSKSPFATPGVSPVESYKQILLNDSVLSAARQSNAEIEKPKVQPILQTSVINLSIRGSTPDLARRNALIYHHAFEERLEALRSSEIDNKVAAAQAQLSGYESRVKEAQQKLFAYRAQAELIDESQFESSNKTLAELRSQALRAQSELAAKHAEVEKMANDLGITSDLARDAFVLQADISFQEMLSMLADLGTQLPQYELRFDANHPKLRNAALEFETLGDALRLRSKQLVGHEGFSSLQLLTLARSEQRAELFAELIKLSTEEAGHRARVARLEKDISQLDYRLRVDLKERSHLEDLNREHQLAEAVFVSALTRLETLDSNPFNVYPMVQVLSEPSVPTKPSSPHRIIALVVGCVGSIMLIVTLILAWNRDKWIKSILKKD